MRVCRVPWAQIVRDDKRDPFANDIQEPGVVITLTRLGSPLGRTLAFLLFQHKAELGTKHVTEIVIFRDNFPKGTMPSVQMLFKIKDVPEPAAAVGAESARALRLRSSLLDDGLKNKVHLHKLFWDSRALVIGSA